jgi:glycosyltransferase involved in cell wall biosynthesis
MSTETVEVQKKHGFFKGANVRKKRLLNKGKLHYVVPLSLKYKLKQTAEQSIVTPDSRNNITFISHSIPWDYKQPSHSRILTILKILHELKYEIRYITLLTENAKRKQKNIVPKSIESLVTNNYKEIIRSIITKNESTSIWILNSEDIGYLRTIELIVQELRNHKIPIQIIFDNSQLVDSRSRRNGKTYLKYLGNMQMRENIEILERIKEHADILVVSTEIQRKNLMDTNASIAHAEVMPDVHVFDESNLPYPRRKNICFITDLRSKANIAAVEYFRKHIFPLILNRYPTCKFHVLTENVQEHNLKVTHSSVKFLRLPHPYRDFIKNYRLAVFPLTLSDATNEGVAIAAAAGIPIVATSNGAEGYPIKDGEECFIADCPMEFAEKCIQCLEDSMAWNNFSIRSKLMSAEHYSKPFVARKLINIVSDRKITLRN